MIAHLLTLAAVSLATPTSPAAQIAVPPSPTLALPATEPVRDPFAVQFDLPSTITGRTYRIFVQRPPVPAPEEGWPVIYVLDGNAIFSIAASQVHLRTEFGQSGAVVVGIGYPDAAAQLKLRNFDLTPSAPLPGSFDDPGAKPGDFGGAALFHRFMIEELRPVIAAMEPVNRENQSLIGYSLGGLFALGVLFDHPDAYRTVVAGSPSIWWNNRELLKKEAGFAAAVRAGKVSTRLLITSDGWEQSPPDNALPSDPKARAAELKEAADAAMVDNAKRLANRLGTLKGALGYRVRYALFPEETHLTGIPASTSRGVAFTFLP